MFLFNVGFMKTTAGFEIDCITDILQFALDKYNSFGYKKSDVLCGSYSW